MVWNPIIINIPIAGIANPISIRIRLDWRVNTCRVWIGCCLAVVHHIAHAIAVRVLLVGVGVVRAVVQVVDDTITVPVWRVQIPVARPAPAALSCAPTRRRARRAR